MRPKELDLLEEGALLGVSPVPVLLQRCRPGWLLDLSLEVPTEQSIVSNL